MGPIANPPRMDGHGILAQTSKLEHWEDRPGSLAILEPPAFGSLRLCVLQPNLAQWIGIQGDFGSNGWLSELASANFPATALVIDAFDKTISGVPKLGVLPFNFKPGHFKSNREANCFWTHLF